MPSLSEMCQPGILAPVPAMGRYLSFRRAGGGNPRRALSRLAELGGGAEIVIGIGACVAAELGARIDRLRDPRALSGPGVSVPATPAALWCWLRGLDDGKGDRGELLHRGRELSAAVADSFALDSVVDGFQHGGGRDLTGFEDGTENPAGAAAAEAALAGDLGAGLDGSSFVAVQLWRHDLDRFAQFGAGERDAIIGRRRDTNEQLADPPPSAHIQRTDQESFSPQAFVLRRSMPWTDGRGEGLVFVAFGRSFDAFEAQLSRMAGHDDGVTDALFRFTRPESTAYLWCPPVSGGSLDLSALDRS